MYLYTPLWQRGARGDFLSIILKPPFIPLCQRGIKVPEAEELLKNSFDPILRLFGENTWRRPR
jgi:hypothetical protein